MRIAVLCTDQGVRIPGGKGASLHLLAISRAFARLGHEVLLIGVAGQGEPPPELRCIRLAHPGRSEGVERERRKLRLVERVVAEAAEPLCAFAPHVLYERLSLFGTAGARLAAKTGALHVVEVNALLAEEEARWRELHHVDEAVHREASVLRSAQLRVCVSAELAARVARIAGDEATIVVPNGVDADLFARPVDRATARQQLHLPPDAPVLGFVGSVRPWHGLETAIAALVELPSAELVVAGDGPTRTDLEASAETLDVGARVHWLGAQPHDQIPSVLAALDVALAPYPLLDDFAYSPLKLYEYLAAGVPIVASDIGQVRTALDGGRWGQLVAPGDASSLAGGIRRVLGDIDAARERAELARRWTHECHDWTTRATSIVEAAEARFVHDGTGTS